MIKCDLLYHDIHLTNTFFFVRQNEEKLATEKQYETSGKLVAYNTNC